VLVGHERLVRPFHRLGEQLRARRLAAQGDGK